MSDPEKYTVGWICAIDTEAVAAVAFFDEEHEPVRHIGRDDNNSYELGRMGDHNVVIAVLPDGEYGTNSAAAVARDMARSFPNIRIGLMVGIGGGAPSPEHDIRLGDVVVSRPEGGMSGVIQYDFGKTIQDQTFRQTGFLNQPPALLRTAASALRRRYRGKGHNLTEEADKALSKIKKKKRFTRPPGSQDRLYRSHVVHPASGGSPNDKCELSCGLDNSRLIVRENRDEEDDDPAIHYGLIASGNQLMKDARIRDQLASEKHILCFDMEAAGLMNHFPCMVIRGICDYSDSHKNKDWQGFAALMAAAYAKDLLRQIHPTSLEAQVRIEELLAEVEHKVSTVQITSEAIKSNLHAARMKEWLSPPDPSTNANMARKVRHEGSGNWLLQSTVFQTWQAGSLRHLWLRGLAGCGKTVLSAAVLDHLAAQNAQSSSNIILSFFFDFSDKEKQTVDGMLRSLAYQLYSDGDERSRQCLDKLFEEQSHGLNQPSSAALDVTICSMLAAQECNTYILLDALDEATERRTLLEWIANVYRAPGLGHVRLIYTGRPESELLQDLPQTIGQEACLTLDKEAINADIRSYVKAKLKDKPFEHQNLSEDIQSKIQSKVGGGADGMFRWATCQLDTLSRCMTPHATRKALDNLPKDLHQTYARMMSSIPDALRTDAARLLKFLVHAERPLTLVETIDVIATGAEEDETPTFDIERRLHHHHDILQYCPGLISIINVPTEDYDEEDWEVSTEVHLAHFSVKEYLLMQDQFSITSGSLCIARTCLAYIADVNRTITSNIQFVKHDIFAKFHLQDYATQYWMRHAASSEISGQLVEEAMDFLNDQTIFKIWRRLLDLEHRSGTPLTYACINGWAKIAQRLLDEGADINDQSGFYGNSLQAASSKGQVETVRLLLGNGADVNRLSGDYGTALQAASAGGTEHHREIVRLLLDKGADVNARAGGFCTALQAASYGGTKSHREILQLLLDKGADVNTRGGRYFTALYAACSQGTADHEEAVKLLLSRGADIDAHNAHVGNALYAASYGRHQGIVQLLLENGAQVNALSGGPFGNALQAAAEGGHLAIAQLLLDKGADVNAPGGHYGSALQAACDGGYADVIQLLLDRDADVNRLGGHYGSAMQAVCLRGNREMAELLLSKGADINAQSGKFDNALQAASTGGHLEIARLLINKGADINALGGCYGTALQAAAEGGYYEIVQLLLDHGANANAQQGGKYDTALQAASRRGFVEIVRLLLIHGADVSAQGGGSYGNALCAASYYGYQEIVQLLLNWGANIFTHHATPGSYCNALEAALGGGQQEVLLLLQSRLAWCNNILL